MANLILTEQDEFAIFNSYTSIPLFLNSTFSGGNGDDFIYGDSKTLRIEAHADFNSANLLVSPPLLVMGNDTLSGAAGNDWLVGDVKNVIIKMEGGTSYPLYSSAIIANLDIRMGSDTLSGGTGDDTLFGDVEHMTIEARAGSGYYQNASAALFRSKFTFGHDTLIGDVGNDLLIGDVGTLEINLIGGYARGSAFVSDGVAPFNKGNTFTFGNDNLNGGAGNDVLIGDIQLMTLTGHAGIPAVASLYANAQFINNVVTFGNDSLDGGNGQDLLVGDVQTLTMTLQGGTASQGIADALAYDNIITFGLDVLNGGSENDVLIGDVQTLTISVLDGTLAGGALAIAQIHNLKLDFQSDTLMGDEGDDLLIGDIQTLTLNLVNNELVYGQFVASRILMGDDVLVGGNGNDTLYADMVDPTQLDAFLSGASNTLWGGNDLLQGGNGNDKLYAGWGTDRLEGGAGDDILNGGRGTAFMQGGKGNDTLIGSSLGIDVADYSDASSGVTVNLSLAGPQNVGGGLGMDTLVAMDSVVGSRFNDTLTGTSGNNVFYGSDGQDSINGLGGADLLSFINVAQAQVSAQTVAIPAIYGQIYHDLQVELGNPSWLPTPPTAININGVSLVIDTALHQVINGSSVTSYQSIEGFQGTQFNDYIVVDATYLANPNAGPAGSGGTGVMLSGDRGMDVLVGGSGDDVILGGRIDPNYISSGAGNDLIQIGEDLANITFNNPSPQYPFGTPDGFTPNAYGTPLFNLVYAGTGDDTVWAYCSEVGLSLVYLGDGNDTFNDYCSLCSNFVYAGAGDDTFNLKCSTNLERLYGGDGNDIINSLFINVNDIFSGGAGNDTINITGQALGGKIEGGAGADTISALYGNGVYLSYESSNAAVNVNLATRVTSGGDAQGDNISNFNVTDANVIGSAYNDVLTGNKFNNILRGGAGDDMLVGGVASPAFFVNGLWTLSLSDTFSADQGSVLNGWTMWVMTTVDTYEFSNDTLINILDLQTSTSDIIVSGVLGDVQDIAVTLNGISHTYMSDIQAFLMGNGDRGELFTGIGGGQDLTNATITLDDIYGTSFISGTSSGVFKTESGSGLISLLSTSSVIFGLDTADYSDATSGVQVDLAIVGAQNVGGGLGNDTLVSIENLMGSHYNDTLLGNGGNNILNTMGGSDSVDGRGGADVLSFIGIAQPSAPMMTYVIPSFYGVQYSALQAQFGNPDWLPAAPTSFVIDGIMINGAASHSATHGADITTFQNIEGFQGTNMNDYIVMDSTFLTNPNAAAAGPAVPGYLLSGDNGSNVLVGGTGNDVIFGGRGGTSTNFSYISAGSGNDQIQIGANFSEVELQNPTINSPFGTITLGGNSDFTARTPEDVFNIVYAGSGNDVVWSYCSVGVTGGGLSWIDLGAGNDTFMDNCPQCETIVYGGDGNDIFNVQCANFYKFLYGGAGSDTFNIKGQLVANDIIKGDGGNDIFNITDASGGTVNGDAGSDTFNITSASGGTFEGDADSDTFNIIYATGGTFAGGAGNDAFVVTATMGGTLEGGAGADIFVQTGPGATSTEATTTNVTISYAHSSAGVNINLITGAASGGDAQGDNLVDWSYSSPTGQGWAVNTNLMGSLFDDVLKGDYTNNVLTGNGGHNTFLYNLGAFEGNDIITDFISANDTLQLHNVANVAAANSQAVISNDGSGHALATFANGTTIDFTSVTFVTGQHLTDIVSNIIIV
jgi:Ca2+-binding RTX toxin-like protein